MDWIRSQGYTPLAETLLPYWRTRSQGEREAIEDNRQRAIQAVRARLGMPAARRSSSDGRPRLEGGCFLEVGS